MARRRRGEEPGDGSGASGAGTDVRMDVRVTGPAEKVKQTVRTEQDPEREKAKPEVNGTDEKTKFLEALRNPKYLVKVKRLTPRDLNGVKINFEVFSSELPLSLQDIMVEVEKSNGGGKFRAAIVDPEANTTVAAYVFEIDGDPLIETPELTPEEQRMFGQQGGQNAASLTIEGLEQSAKLTAKQIEVETYQQQLRELRDRNGNGAKKVLQDDGRIAALEQKILETRHAAELERVQREAQAKVDEVNKKLDLLLQQKQTPPQPTGPSEMTLLLQQMQKNQEASDKRFEALQKQMQDDKLNAMLEEIKALRNKPNQQSSSLLDQAEAMLKLKKLFGWSDDDDDDGDDDSPDPNDRRPWWERALDKLGDKVIPKLIEKFDGMEEKGTKVTREDFMREIAAAAKAEEDAAVARAQARIAGQANPGLPAPAPTVTQAVPPPPNPPVPGAFKPPTPATPVTELPPAPSSSAAAPATPTATPAAPAAAPATPAGMTLEQEVALRVSGVLEILSREVELRPNEYLWNYEGVWQSLPEELREKIAAAPDPVAMIDVFRLPAINPELLDELKKKIAENPRIVAWLKVGLDELKEWTIEKQKDAKFDPMDEDEEEPV